MTPHPFVNARLNLRLIALAATLLWSSQPTRADTLIIDHARSRYAVVVARDASPSVRQAARELIDDLHAMTGARLPLVMGRRRGADIYVGIGPQVPHRFAAKEINSLAPESVVIESRGGDLLLAGPDERGTLYAVYTFMERYLGARWYAPDATVLPHRDSLNVDKLDVRETPAFAYRDTDEYLAIHSAPWCAHLMLNGVRLPIPGELGGVNRKWNGAENFYEMVPPEKYLATHPEYFSLVKGERTAVKAQLCLTNHDVVRIAIAALIAQARRDPKVLALGLSPNDFPRGNCQCDRCRASDERFGAPSGTLLNFVNQVAAGVQAAFPGHKIWVQTLAYQYTQKPPTLGTIAPANNVMVCLAPIHACFFHPLAADGPNTDPNAALLGWSAIAPGHLYAWHYVTNFINYLQPFPNWDELGADLPYYRAHGVSGIFCEGNWQSDGEMMRMRTWVMAHLMWNPKQDVWALIHDYCNGYYGAAGPDIYRYLRLFHDLVPRHDIHMWAYSGTADAYVNADVRARASAILEHAESVARSLQLKGRVREVGLGIRYVALMQQRYVAPIPIADQPAYRARLAAFVGDLEHFQITQMTEIKDLAQWLAEMEKLD